MAGRAPRESIVNVVTRKRAENALDLQSVIESMVNVAYQNLRVRGRSDVRMEQVVTSPISASRIL